MLLSHSHESYFILWTPMPRFLLSGVDMTTFSHLLRSSLQHGPEIAIVL